MVFTESALDLLGVYAELAVATLGFSGITATFVHVVSDKKFVSIRTKGLLYTSFLALTGAVLPMSGMPALAVVVSLAIAVMGCSTLCLAACVRVGERQANPYLVWLVNLSLIGTAVWLLLSLVLSDVSFEAPYQLLVGLLLISAAVLFIRLILSIDDSRQKGA